MHSTVAVAVSARQLLSALVRACVPALRWYDSRDGENTSVASIASGLIGLLARGPSNPVAVFGSGRASTIPIPLAGGGVIFLAVVRVAGSQTVYGLNQPGGLERYAAVSAPVVGLELCNGPAGSGTDVRVLHTPSDYRQRG